jgi:hypothetical protein
MEWLKHLLVFHSPIVISVNIKYMLFLKDHLSIWYRKFWGEGKILRNEEITVTEIG